MNENETNLKPVIFVKGEYGYHRNNLFQQNLLLRALQVTANPEELRKMVGFKNVAEVYRTLDKIAIRKEYHEALVRHGLDFDYILEKIKGVCDTTESDNAKLKGLQIIMKSLGVDTYKENEAQSKQSWEELIKEQMAKEQTQIEAPTTKFIKYEVNTPEIPEDVRKKKEEEQETGKSLYE